MPAWMNTHKQTRSNYSHAYTQEQTIWGDNVVQRLFAAKCERKDGRKRKSVLSKTPGMSVTSYNAYTELCVITPHIPQQDVLWLHYDERTESSH